MIVIGFDPGSFWAYVFKTDDCWRWIGWRDKDGYGKVRIGDKNYMAHRISYGLVHEEFNPRQTNGLVIDHLCKTKCCVNPNHLREITPYENSTRTHCKHGHEFTVENTGWQLSKQGTNTRYCKKCKNARERERYRANQLRGN